MDADDISPRMENTSSPRVLENMSSAELLDNLSLAQPDNVTWVETVVLVESGNSSQGPGMAQPWSGEAPAGLKVKTHLLARDE